MMSEQEDIVMSKKERNENNENKVESSPNEDVDMLKAYSAEKTLDLTSDYNSLALEQNPTNDGNGNCSNISSTTNGTAHPVLPSVAPPAKKPRTESITLDCYPYTFSPLLLFSQANYFDKGYSNYNSVAKFFEAVLQPIGVNMLSNVLYDRKNMFYDQLFQHVVNNRMFVPCCIDAHCTAFQVINKETLLYYDPLNENVQIVSGGDSFIDFMGYLLLKCNLGNGQHMVDNKSYYVGEDSNRLKSRLYRLWKDINNLDMGRLRVTKHSIPLDLDTYMMINGQYNPTKMSTQLTGNTCYFQTFLFALLCIVGKPSLTTNGRVELNNINKLAESTVAISQFLLCFFVQEENKSANSATANDVNVQTKIMRPLTNSNFVIDFYRYQAAPYFKLFTNYLKHHGLNVPDYVQQYIQTMSYLKNTKTLHYYNRFSLTGAMSSTINTKTLQKICGTNDSTYKMASSNYYKYRATNFMFGFNAGIMHRLRSFCQFNSLRKNQLLMHYNELQPYIQEIVINNTLNKKLNKYRDYYFMGQFEIGQQELVDIHHYTYLIDMCGIHAGDGVDKSDFDRIKHINRFLSNHILFSTQNRNNYDKLMKKQKFLNNQKYFPYFEENFMSLEYFENFVGLGFAEVNPKEKEINSLTQTVFYEVSLMQSQSYRMEYEFEKECINEMARINITKYNRRFNGTSTLTKRYRVRIPIGVGHTYSKYNTLMHFLNVVENYWENPDLNNIQLFGKDVRTLLAISCQKIFFNNEGNSITDQKRNAKTIRASDTTSNSSSNSIDIGEVKDDASDDGSTNARVAGYYHYGVFESSEISSYRQVDMDLAMAAYTGKINPSVSNEERYSKDNLNNLVLTDRVYEYHHLKSILIGMFTRLNSIQMKSDNVVLNLCLLSLMLDFGIFERYGHLLNLPNLHSITSKSMNKKKELQVEIANKIHEFDRKNNSDTVTRIKVEELIFEASYKFIVNKGFDVNSRENKLIQQLNSDPQYQTHLLLCKINLSLCQINKSVEVDYYKVKCNGKYRTIIPYNFSKTTGEYLENNKEVCLCRK